jgi:hypothetical protein
MRCHESDQRCKDEGGCFSDIIRSVPVDLSVRITKICAYLSASIEI